MTDLDPETFDEQKYVEWFPKLQTAYKRAFDRLNDEYDSTLVHAIDQQVLSESEPFYEGDGEFRVEVPENPADRVEGVVASDEKIEQLVSVYVEEIERQLRAVFGVDAADQ
jgi:hypothetical protein